MMDKPGYRLRWLHAIAPVLSSSRLYAMSLRIRSSITFRFSAASDLPQPDDRPARSCGSLSEGNQRAGGESRPFDSNAHWEMQVACHSQERKTRHVLTLWPIKVC